MATSLTISSPSVLSKSMCMDDVVGLTFTLAYDEIGGSDGEMTSIDFYYSDNAELENAATRTDTPANFPTSETILASTSGTVDGTVTLEGEDENCDSYKYLCALIVAHPTTAASISQTVQEEADTSNNDVCLELVDTTTTTTTDSPNNSITTDTPDD
ncbi:uncharacterized protein LOC144363891, partial [Saccoglossus kowalevskii]